MKKYFQASWNIKELLTALTGSVAMLIVSWFVLKHYDISSQTIDGDFKTLKVLGVFLAQWISLFLPFLLINKGYKKIRASNLGLHKYPVLKILLLVVKSYIFYLCISLLITMIILYFNVKVPGYQVQTSVLKMFDDDIFSLMIAGLLIVVIAPVLEELFFRGIILRTLGDQLGLVWGSIISAVLFALLHIPWQSIIPIFILGLILNNIVIKSRSLWPAIVFHIINNAIAFGVQLLILKEVISIETLV